MRIVAVCTGNVARSPALECLLQEGLAGVEVRSAGVGDKAVAGLRMKPYMRMILGREGFGDFAESHRSFVLRGEEAIAPDLFVAVSRVHVRKLGGMFPEVPVLLCDPIIPDPAFGGLDAYEEAWNLIQTASDDMIRRIESEDWGSCE